MADESAAIRISLLTTSHLELLVSAGPFGFSCPRCGYEEIEGWAEDGEASLADWWECRHCKAAGAYLHEKLPGVTQNGVPLKGYSPLFATA